MSMNRYIYDKVNRLIKKYKTRDPIELIEALNINLVYLPETKILLGMYHYIQRNRFIFISSNTNFNRKTILAHELGHDQLHRDYCMSGGAFHDQTVLNPTNKFETEANIFAAHLLISDEDVFDNINDQVCDYEIAGKLGVDINLLNQLMLIYLREIFLKTIALNMMIIIRRLYGNFYCRIFFINPFWNSFLLSHLYLLCKNLSIFD